MFKTLITYLTKKTNLSDADILTICSHFTQKKVRRNELLIDHSQVCSSYYFINKGAARIFTINSEGIETVRYFAFENSFCTALPSFIDQNPSQEYLQIIEKGNLLIITRESFYKLIKQFPDFESMYREILENAFIISQQRIYGFQGFNALEKVQWIIKNQPEILQKVSNKMAASYLGMSPSTLSRVKAKL